MNDVPADRGPIESGGISVRLVCLHMRNGVIAYRLTCDVEPDDALGFVALASEVTLIAADTRPRLSELPDGAKTGCHAAILSCLEQPPKVT
jgi:hypothetical protein